MLSMTFGIQPPATASCAWGARAIYYGKGMDLLPDRQCVEGEDTQPLIDWLNQQALPYLREKIRQSTLPDPHERATVVVRGGGYCLHASPRASYGYLYLGAWPDPTATNPDLRIDMLEDLLADYRNTILACAEADQ